MANDSTPQEIPEAPDPFEFSESVIFPEISPGNLTVNSGGNSEEKLWDKLGKYLPNWPTPEKVAVGSGCADILLRVLMSFAFLGVASVWLWFVSNIVREQTPEKHLSDTVLVTLLTTTTINVLGLLYFVANYLFPKQQRSDNATPLPPEPPK